MTVEYNKILLHISCLNALGSFVHTKIVHCWTKRASLAALARHTMCARMYRAKKYKTTRRKSDNAARYKHLNVFRVYYVGITHSYVLFIRIRHLAGRAKPAHIHVPSHFGEILRSPGEKLAFDGFWRNVSQHFEARSGSLNSATRQLRRWKSFPPLDRSDLFRRSTCWFLEDSCQLQSKSKHMQNVCH